MKLNNTNFRRNKIKGLMLAETQSLIYIDFVTFTNNHVTFVMFNISGDSKLEMCNAEVRQNNLPLLLSLLSSNSIIQGKTRIKNNVSKAVYVITENSGIQLNHVAFTQNKFELFLFRLESNSSAIINNNKLIENNVSWVVYGVTKNSSIQLNHVAFTRNKLEEPLLWIPSNSSAIIQNNILTENNVSGVVYGTMENSNIVLNHVAFTQKMYLG